jgi:hypothetical protein
MELDFIRAKFKRREYVIDPEHILMLNKYGVSAADMERAIASSEIIETFPHTLLLGFTSNGQPLHVACSYWSAQDVIYVRTVYIPDDRWEPDWRTRKKDWKKR